MRDGIRLGDHRRPPPNLQKGTERGECPGVLRRWYFDVLDHEPDVETSDVAC